MFERDTIDIFLSHDWPRGIARYGDMNTLLRRKQFLRREVETNTLGSPASEELLHSLKPKYWFAAHMHVKFSAVVPHEGDVGPTKVGDILTYLRYDSCE